MSLDPSNEPPSEVNDISNLATQAPDTTAPEPEAPETTAPESEAPEPEAPSNSKTHNRLNGEKPSLTKTQAQDFLKHSDLEHRWHLAALLAVLIAPSTFFLTLWFPLERGSFAQVNPPASIRTGLLIAGLLIATGLVIHFLPRKRDAIVVAVERRQLVASESSEQLVNTERVKPVRRQYIFAALAIILAICFAILAISSLGDVRAIFLYAALSLATFSLGICFIYNAYHEKRIIQLLSKV